jgi:membrane protein
MTATAAAARGSSADAGLFGIAKAAVKDFLQDECQTLAAAISYFTIFSLPALLVLIIMLAGAVWDPQDIEGALKGQIEGLMGAGGAQQVQTMLAKTDRLGGKGILATVIGLLTLIIGATGAFGALQQGLNRAWEVKPDPKQGGLKNFVVKRLFSLGMILSLAFLLLVSLALSAILSALGGALSSMMGGLSDVVLLVLNHVVSLAVITLLFAAMFKVLPDATVSWRDVWVGGFATALLFEIGKFLIGFYLGRSNPGEAFGAAGALALMLVWIYYSAMIVLLGAEFTQQWANTRGGGIEPEEGAVRVVEQAREVRPDSGPGAVEERRGL